MNSFRPTQSAAWLEILRECRGHDFYHLPGYHAIAEARGEGEAHLFAHRDGGYVMALPLLLRPVNAFPGLEDADGRFVDATSVYGYAGPIASHAPLPEAVRARFHSALRDALLSLRVTTVFSRLHPLLPHVDVLAGLGDTIPRGRTVSLDLTRSIGEQRAGYRYSLRRDLRLLGNRGVVCVADPGNARLHTFAAVYREAMTRLQAGEEYFFDDAYFDDLAEALGDAMQLFVCELDGRVIAGGVITAVRDLAQMHLAACLDDCVKISPQKLLYDAGSVWARERGCHSLHIGGGVGSSEDSLFHFKLGFSDVTHSFSTWHWAVDPVAADALTAHRARWMGANDFVPARADFFPAYRVPVVKGNRVSAGNAGGPARALISALLAVSLWFEIPLLDMDCRPGPLAVQFEAGAFFHSHFRSSFA